MKRILSSILFVWVAMLVPFAAKAQEPEMADALRSEGKIYVVVAIMLIIFAGLIAYLILLDRRLTQAERRLSEKK